MYSYEDRKRAVDLYFKYKSYTAVIKELEYPSSRTSLIKWVKEFNKNKRLQQKSTRTLKYSEEEQKKTIDYYLTHGKCIAKTVKDLGYPSKGLLSLWISKNLQESHIGRTTIKSSVYFSNEIKQKAVTEFMAENKTAATVSAEYGVRMDVFVTGNMKYLEIKKYHLCAKEKRIQRYMTWKLLIKN